MSLGLFGDNMAQTFTCLTQINRVIGNSEIVTNSLITWLHLNFLPVGKLLIFRRLENDLLVTEIIASDYRGHVWVQ